MPTPDPTPDPPYYAVIFTSRRADSGLDDGYGAMADRMEDLARAQPGFLGLESTRGPDGVGITVSYWDSLDAVRRWGEHAEHLVAQRLGRERFYEWFRLRVCLVEEFRVFPIRPGEPPGPASA